MLSSNLLPIYFRFLSFFCHVALYIVALFGQLHIDSDLSQFPLLLNTATANETTSTPTAKAECLDLVSSELSTDGRRLLDLISLKLNSASSSEGVQNFANVILNSDKVINPFSSDGSTADAQLAGATDLFLADVTSKDWEILKSLLRPKIEVIETERVSRNTIDKKASKLVGFNPLSESPTQGDMITENSPQLIETPNGDVYILTLEQDILDNNEKLTGHYIYKYDLPSGNLKFISGMNKVKVPPDEGSNHFNEGRFFPISRAINETQVFGVVFRGSVELVILDLITRETEVLHTFSTLNKLHGLKPLFFQKSENEVFFYLTYNNESDHRTDAFVYLNLASKEFKFLNTDSQMVHGSITQMMADKNGNIHWIDFGSTSTIFSLDNNSDTISENDSNSRRFENSQRKRTDLFLTNNGQWLIASTNKTFSETTFLKMDSSSNELSKIGEMKHDFVTYIYLGATFFENSDGSIYVAIQYKQDAKKELVAIFSINEKLDTTRHIKTIESPFDPSVHQKKDEERIAFFEDNSGRPFFFMTESSGKHQIYDLSSDANTPYMTARREFTKNVNLGANNYELLHLNYGDFLIVGVAQTKHLGITHVQTGK